MCNTCNNKNSNCNCNKKDSRYLATIADIRATIAKLNVKINEALQEVNYPTLQSATERGNITDNYITFKKVLQDLNLEDLSKIYNSLTILQTDLVAKLIFNTYTDKLQPTSIQLTKDKVEVSIEDILLLAVAQDQSEFKTKVSGLSAVNENDFVTLQQLSSAAVQKYRKTEW